MAPSASASSRSAHEGSRRGKATLEASGRTRGASALTPPETDDILRKKGVIVEESSVNDSASETDDEDPADVARLRQARSSYYAKPPTERTREAQPMAQERRRKTGTTGGSVAAVHVASSRASVAHRRRRKRKTKEVEEERGGDFVYRTVTTTTTTTGKRPERTRSTTVREPVRRASSTSQRPETRTSTTRDAVPERSTASRLGLGLPSRRPSQRSIRVASEDMVKRRHSYHGDVRPKRTTRESSQESLRPERPLPKRSVSMRETSRASSSKESLVRSPTIKTRARPSLPMVPEEGKPPTSPLARTNSVFGSIFGPSRASTAPERKVACLTCLDDIPISRTAKLECGHRMCRDCLKRIFTMSVTDPAHMPPRCCTNECIPLKHVDRLFDTKFKIRWNRKYQEYTTANRLYCPSRGCGAWIPPKDIRPDPAHRGRRYGKCTRCRTKVCATCNNRWHAARACPNDEETQRFVSLAKEQGWQQCFNCQATVELKEGCNHMTCRCTAQFCMICGAKWKTCDCPWFNYAAVTADRMQHLNVAQVRRVARDPAVAAEQWHRPRAYHEELERRRDQERRDEALARRMQGLDLDRHLATRPHRIRAGRSANDPAEWDDDTPDFAQPANLTPDGHGAPLHGDFVQRATAILTSPVNPARAAAADRLVAELRQQRGSGTPTTASSATPRRRTATTGSPSPRTPSGVASPRVIEVPVVRRAGRAAERLLPRHAPRDVRYAAHAARVRPVRAEQADGASEGEGSGEEDGRVPVPERRRGAVVATRSRVVRDKSSKIGKGKEKQRESTKGKASVEEDEGDSEEEEDSAMRAATLAGLTRKSTHGRVDAWRRFVGPGIVT